MEVHRVSSSASGVCLRGRREALGGNKGSVHVVEQVGPDLTDVCGII